MCITEQVTCWIKAREREKHSVLSWMTGVLFDVHLSALLGLHSDGVHAGANRDTQHCTFVCLFVRSFV